MVWLKSSHQRKSNKLQNKIKTKERLKVDQGNEVISGHVSSKMWNFSLVFPHIISPYSPSPVWSLMIQNRDTQNSCFNITSFGENHCFDPFPPYDPPPPPWYTLLESYGSHLSDRPARIFSHSVHRRMQYFGYER